MTVGYWISPYPRSILAPESSKERQFNWYCFCTFRPSSVSPVQQTPTMAKGAFWYCFTSDRPCSNISRHGGQVGDQNSNTTTLPFNAASVMGWPSKSGPLILGACRPGLSPVRVNVLGGEDDDSQPVIFSVPATIPARPIFNMFLRSMSHQKRVKNFMSPRPNANQQRAAKFKPMRHRSSRHIVRGTSFRLFIGYRGRCSQIQTAQRQNEWLTHTMSTTKSST